LQQIICHPVAPFRALSPFISQEICFLTANLRATACRKPASMSWAFHRR
jgi:hypothetical protein